jgi:hypothetical protein
MISTLLHLVERDLSVMEATGVRLFAPEALLTELLAVQGPSRRVAAGDESCRSRPALDLAP